jgi:site-specific DNA-adenine methylase
MARYIGGKQKIRRRLTDAIRNHGKHTLGTLIWEPFCGGLGMTEGLAELGPVICSDINPALIALYRAVRAGWEPPTELTPAEWKAARNGPVDSPMRAFSLLCSFGGTGNTLGRPFLDAAGKTVNPVKQAHNAVKRQAAVPVSFDCWSFTDQPPRPGVTLYLDPPYAGTTGYKDAPPFDHQAFWAHAEAWSKATHVYVSELHAPEGWAVIWSKARRTGVNSNRPGGAVPTVECLFWKGPS